MPTTAKLKGAAVNSLDNETKNRLDELLKTVSDIDGKPSGAYNIRVNGGCAEKHSTEHVKIDSKPDNSGIDIRISGEAQDETVLIPACITESDVDDLVYNDFHVGAGAKVRIIAGCGIHIDGDKQSKHQGIHRFFIGKGAHVTYLEKHIGVGAGSGDAVIDPETYFEIEDGGYLEMITSQLSGVKRSIRSTGGKVFDNASLIIRESLMTDDDEYAETNFKVDMVGSNSGVTLISRSVAKGKSIQKYKSTIHGNASCTGHSACDAIIVGEGRVDATSELIANHPDAMLIHEAAIGKIAGEQIIKLQTLGLTEEEAEEKIIQGFLK